MNQQEPDFDNRSCEKEDEDTRNRKTTTENHQDCYAEQEDDLELLEIVLVPQREVSSLSNGTIKFPLLRDFEAVTNREQWLRTISFESKNGTKVEPILSSSSSAAAVAASAGSVLHANRQLSSLHYELPTNITVRHVLPDHYPCYPNQEILLEQQQDDSEASSYCTPISSTAPAVYVNINPEGLVMAHAVTESTLVKPPDNLPLADTEGPNSSTDKHFKKIKHSRMRRAVVVALILFLMLLVLTTYFVVKRKQEESMQASFSSTNETTPTTPTSSASPTSSSSSSSSPQQVAYGNSMARILSLLPQDTILQLDDPHSSQSHAFDWIVNDLTLPAITDWRVVQRFALATLFFATAGNTHWISNQHWLSYEKHECEWFMLALAAHEKDDKNGAYTSNNTSIERPFLCKKYYRDNHTDTLHDNNTNNNSQESLGERVTHINLGRNGLDGTIPPELYLLTDLESVNLAANRLHGPILLPQIRQLSHLLYLDVSSNKLTSSILPTELGLLTQLSQLVLWNSSLTGTIPSQLGLATLLSKLDLHTNHLTGTIPTELARLTNVAWLDISNNALTGTLPEQFGHWATQRTDDSHGDSLTRFDVSLNDLSGTIPSSLCSLTMDGPSLSLMLDFDCSYKLCGCSCICT